MRHPDLVKRDFAITGQNKLWMTDLTYVLTLTVIAYVCITDDYSRMIVGRVKQHDEWVGGRRYLLEDGVEEDDGVEGRRILTTSTRPS